MLIHTTYNKQLFSAFSGAWLGETPVEISADVTQNGDAIKVDFTKECREAMALAGFDEAELDGAQEASEEAFHLAEREDCRQVRVAQQTGDQAFFDKRNAGRAA